MTDPAPEGAPHGTNGAELFCHQAALYAQYRPDYPPSLFDAIMRFAALDGRPSLALDVATGSGQVASALADSFDRVLACDSTQQQLDHAVKHRSNVSYFLSPAERLEGVGSRTVDLLTAAQCMHWFDFPAFIAEARRVLKPRGTLAIWGYGLPFFASPPGCSYSAVALADLRQALQDLHTSVLGAHWDHRRRLVDNGYRGLEPGPGHFAVVERQETSMHKHLSVAQVMGYLASWSSYAAYRRQHPQATDPLAAFQQQLLAALGEVGPGSTADAGRAAAAGPEVEAGAGAAAEAGAGVGESAGAVLRLEWPLFVILAKGPAPPAAGGPAR